VLSAANCDLIRTELVLMGGAEALGRDVAQDGSCRRRSWVCVDKKLFAWHITGCERSKDEILTDSRRDNAASARFTVQ
jgi:hypothetical protein